MNLRCDECRWWISGGNFGNFGGCRANPPTPRTPDGFGVWPLTMDTDWCGKWTALKKPPKAEPAHPQM